MAAKPGVIIIGAGLAGLSAGWRLARLGAGVLILDENPRPGGQYLKHPDPGLGVGTGFKGDKLRLQGLDLISLVQGAGVEVLTGTRVLGIEPEGSVWFEGPRPRVREERAELIILATGARERFIPFPGWTLPGVIATGAAQIMLKAQGILPAPEVVVAGSGPLPLTLAAEIVSCGGNVAAFIDQTGPGGAMKQVSNLRYHPGKLLSGFLDSARLVLGGTKIVPSGRVIEARGDGGLEEVVVADRSGRTRTIGTGCLAVGHGFTPNLELAGQAGCELEYRPGRSGWAVRTDDQLRTTVSGILAAGEPTGIGGAAKALIEGELAGLTGGLDLGLIDRSRIEPALVDLGKRRERELVLGRAVAGLTRPKPGWSRDLDDSIIICRCEDITLGRVRAAIRTGSATLDGLKKATRTGMGICQGRTCGPILQAVIEDLVGLVEPEPFSSRMPVKPVRMSDLARLAPEES